MTANIENRLKRLEEAAGPAMAPVVRLIANDGETMDACIRRHGYEPDDEGHSFIVRTIVDPRPLPAAFARGLH